MLALMVGIGIAAEDKKGGLARQTEGHRPQDSNGDGRITRDEWPGNDQSFKKLDRDGDGALTSRDRKLRTTQKKVHGKRAPKK